MFVLLLILSGGNIAFLREEGGTRSVTEGARVTLACTDFIVTRSPSPDFVGSSLPEGAFGLRTPKVRLLFLTSTAFVDTKAKQTQATVEKQEICSIEKILEDGIIILQFREVETMNIGNNIKQLRQKNNLTQDQVAEKVGVSYQAVSKWENNANTPDIALLPQIANLFGVSIDALFSDDLTACSELQSFMKDDNVIRVVQMRGTKVLKVSSTFSPDEPPIEIAFPHDCNDRTQYFKVEIYGHVISDSSINGDVVCHQTVKSSTINGDVKTEGNIDVHELNAQKVICNNITDCYKLQAKTIECVGNVVSANVTCDQIIYKK